MKPQKPLPLPLLICLDQGTLGKAVAGNHNFLNRVVNAVAGSGFQPEFRLWTADAAFAPANDRAFSLIEMKPPIGDRSLTFRLAYMAPFWRIEKSDERWNWDVARASFPPEGFDRSDAGWFARYWRRRQFPDARTATREGFVLIPLQARLLQHRSFQTGAPLAMIEAVLEHLPGRKVVATLHPRAPYEAGEIAALDALVARYPRLSVSRGDTDRLLPQADLVVSENSASAFKGYFFHKPTVLFARADFHHIAANVGALGAEAALRGAEDMKPDYDGYLLWFLRDMAVNAAKETAEDRIRGRLRNGGWPI